MGVRGMDISNHQAGMDVERVVRENNIGFVFILSNDGTFKNPYYQSQMAAARRGGALAVPYIYLRTNVDQTYATFRQQEPNPGPAIVDVEDGSGGRAECDRMHSLLHRDGYSTPLLYWPDWYRKKVGSPSLAGLPPLWTSWYPDYVNRGFDAGLAMVPAWLWNGYGGLPTRIVQFTSSGRLSGYGGNLDLNYFPGSREDLAALLGFSRPRPRARAKGEAMLIVNIDTNEYAILSGGVLTGVTPDNARASRDKWGIPELGVTASEWLDMQAKSAAIEQAGVRAEQTQALLREAIAAVKQIPGAPGGAVVGDGDVSRIATATATATADLMDKRLRDNDPDTGPVS